LADTTKEKQMQTHYSKRKQRLQSRVEYLYRTQYRQECKSEGLSGAALRAEGLRRAKRHYALENKQVQLQAMGIKEETPKPKQPTLLKILPKSP
jgi:hypothetical protein